MTQSYVHHFSNGLRAVATLATDPPGYRVEWSSPPDRGIVGEYLTWRKVIVADFERQTGQRVLVVDLATAPTLEP